MNCIKKKVMVLVVFGLPGSGKSYLASRLAQLLGALYYNSDQLRLQLIADRNYSETEKLQVYNLMLWAMEIAISQQKDIVLDATFYKRSIRTMFEERAASLQESFLYVEVTAEEEVIKERVSKPREFSEADFNVYLKLKAIAEPLEQDHLILHSTNHNIDAMLQEAMNYIKSKR